MSLVHSFSLACSVGICTVTCVMGFNFLCAESLDLTNFSINIYGLMDASVRLIFLFSVSENFTLQNCVYKAFQSSLDDIYLFSEHL